MTDSRTKTRFWIYARSRNSTKNLAQPIIGLHSIHWNNYRLSKIIIYICVVLQPLGRRYHRLDILVVLSTADSYEDQSQPHHGCLSWFFGFSLHHQINACFFIKPAHRTNLNQTNRRSADSGRTRSDPGALKPRFLQHRR